ncbi:MAG TPA: hypothetical protein VIT89_04140 [Solirubrobacterales bacterium]
MALLLLALVGAVVLGSGSPSSPPAPAPRGCLTRWNGSTKARVYGYHAFHRHGYRETKILYLDHAGVASRQGRCAVAFASDALDREPAAAVKVFEGRWRPLSATEGISDVRLSELQFEAAKEANALLRPDGTLSPLL